MNPELRNQLQTLVDQIPFAKQFRFKVIKAKRGLVEVSLRPSLNLFNHFEKYQAGVCFTLAEITGGLVCGSFIDLSRNLLITKKIEVWYQRASDVDLVAMAEIKNEKIEHILSVLNEKKKTTIMIEVIVKDKDQRVVVQSSNDYYLRKGIPRSISKQSNPNKLYQ